jgi:transposase
MSARAEFPEGSHEVLAALRREVNTKAEFQRVQAVWLRVTLELSDEQIAQAVGLSANTVRCLGSRFRRQGASALAGAGRGGRRHENLTVAQEQELLQPFLEPAGRGRLLQVSPIKTADERVVGHPVPPSTIYRLLGRHGWRQLAPRPRHPKAVSARRPALAGPGVGGR